MASDNSLTIAGVGGVGGDPLTDRAMAWNSFDKVQVLPDVETDKAKAPPEGETGWVPKAFVAVVPVMLSSQANASGWPDGDTDPWLTAWAFWVCPSTPDLVYSSPQVAPTGVNAGAGAQRPVVEATVAK
jgi:hypothetical protein